MSRAIDELLHEHEAILFSLGLLQKMADAARSDATSPSSAWNSEDARELVGFLKEFADGCHHGKEEGILFPAMEKAGILNDGGPIGVMLHEHELGRERIRGMKAALERAATGDGAANEAFARETFASEAEGYIELLRQHIEKENKILFPMGEKALSAETLERLYGLFEDHEERVIGHGRHEELHAMLGEFEKRYMKG
jgi:hemerythrin-like domain-containing protein